MEWNIQDWLCSEKGYRIRYMKSLYKQFKNDHIAFMQLWQKCKERTISTAEAQELNRFSCWLREEMRIIRKLGKIEIEETIYGEIVYIENKLKNIRININKIVRNGGGDYRPPAPTLTARGRSQEL